MGSKRMLNADLFYYIKDNLKFDQLIWNGNDNQPQWIHVGYNKSGNRNQVLKQLNQVKQFMRYFNLKYLLTFYL
jgi:hypothetical protein